MAFTPWKCANTTNQGIFSRELVLNSHQHTTAPLLPPCPNTLLDSRLGQAGEAKEEKEEAGMWATPHSAPFEHSNGLKQARTVLNHI